MSAHISALVIILLATVCALAAVVVCMARQARRIAAQQPQAVADAWDDTIIMEARGE